MFSLLNDQGIQRRSSPLILQTQQTNIPHLWWKCASHGYTIHQNTNSLNRVYLPDIFSAFLALIQPRLSQTVFCLQWPKLFSARLAWVNGSGKKYIFHWKNEGHFQKRLLNHYSEAVALHSVGIPRANIDIKYHFHRSGIFHTEK